MKTSIKMNIHGQTRRIAAAPVGDAVVVLLSAAILAAGRSRQWAAKVARTLESRRMMADLAALDDHMLKDMGITRADVRDAVSEPFGADPTRLLMARATERQAARRRAVRSGRPD